MSHLDAGVIHELLDGEIPSSQLAPIQAHLSACAECRARLDEERQLLADVDELIEVVEVPAAETEPMARPISRPRSTRWLRDLAWAATLVIAAGLGYAVRGPRVLAPKAESVPPQTNNAVAQRDSPATTASLAQQNSPVGTTAPDAAKPAAPKPDVAAASKNAAPASPVRSNAGDDGRAGAAAERRVDSVARRLPQGRVDSAMAKTAIPVESKELVRSVAGVAAPPPSASSARDAALRAPPDGFRSNVAQSRSNSGRGGRATAKIDTIALPEAMQRLGGTIRLIDGLVPLRLEFQEPYVRVVYPDGLVLRQQLIDGHVVSELVAPATFSADSLAKLRGKVRE